MNIDLDKIQALIKELSGLQPIKAEHLKELEKKFRLEFNYNSNHLEGNTLTYSETKLLLIFDDAKGDHTLRELEEMKGSDVAFQLVEEWANDKERVLTEQNIKSLNQILLVRPFWKDAITPDGQQTRRLIKVGDYKEFPNSVRLENGTIFEYASPHDTPILMGELIQWYRDEEKKGELHPIVLAALFHYKFVRIHPFDDGNGRISRLLMNYVLFKNNLPPVVIQSSDKRNYLAALNRADAGDIEDFVKYVSEQLAWSLELCIKAAKGESLDEPGDLDKKIKLLKQKLNSANEEVKVVKNNASILDAYTKSIEPLILQLTIKLGQFDNLFKSKKNLLYRDGNIGTNNERFKEYLKAKTDEIDSLSYLYELVDFRKKNKEFSVSVAFRIYFHHHVYELTSTEVNLSINKLYHESFSQEEIDSIVEKLGTKMYEKIEKNLGDI